MYIVLIFKKKERFFEIFYTPEEKYKKNLIFCKIFIQYVSFFILPQLEMPSQESRQSCRYSLFFNFYYGSKTY